MDWPERGEEKGKKGKCGVQWEARGEKRKTEEAQHGGIWKTGDICGGGPLFSGTPAPTLHFFREAKSHPLLPTDSS